VPDDTRAQDTGEPPRPPSAIVVDDDAIARRTIRESLQRAGVEVIAEAENGRKAVELALRHRPDVVLMDVVMPEMDGIAATREILKHAPEQRVLILTTSDDDEMGLLGLRVGASGFLTKNLDVDVLPRALTGVMNDEAAISRRLSMRVVEQMRKPAAPGGMRPVKSPLTTREWEVIDLIGSGKSTDQIAAELVLSGETVRSHVKNILRKLDAHSREEAVAITQRMRADGG
jgi:two-component system, NarL family, response regulator LiaR